MTLRASLAYFAIRAFNGVVALLSIALLTRLLSPEDFGRYSLALSAATATASVCFQWLNTATSRFYASVEDPARIIGTAFRAWIVISAAVAMAAVACATLLPDFAGWKVPLLVALGASAFGVYNLGLQIANAQGSPRRYARLSNIRSAVALLATAAIITLGGGSQGALLATFLVTLLIGLAGGGFLSHAPASSDRDLRHAMLLYGLPQTATYLSIMTIDFADRFMLASWHGAASVAPYAASYDMTQQTVGVLLNVLYLASFPSVVKDWEQARMDDVRRSCTRLLLAASFTASLACTGLIAVAPVLVQVVLGPQIAAGAAELIPPIAIAIALGGLKAYCFDIPLQLQKRSKLLVTISIGMAAISVVGNLMFIPRFGALGAAWAAALAFGIGALSSLIAGRDCRLFDANVATLALRCVLACGVAVALMRTALPSLESSDWPSAVTLMVSGAAAMIVGVLTLLLFAPRQIRALLRSERRD